MLKRRKWFQNCVAIPDHQRTGLLHNTKSRTDEEVLKFRANYLNLPVGMQVRGYPRSKLLDTLRTRSDGNREPKKNPKQSVGFLNYNNYLLSNSTIP